MLWLKLTFTYYVKVILKIYQFIQPLFRQLRLDNLLFEVNFFAFIQLTNLPSLLPSI